MFLLITSVLNWTGLGYDNQIDRPSGIKGTGSCLIMNILHTYGGVNPSMHHYLYRISTCKSKSTEVVLVKLMFPSALCLAYIEDIISKRILMTFFLYDGVIFL